MLEDAHPLAVGADSVVEGWFMEILCEHLARSLQLLAPRARPSNNRIESQCQAGIAASQLDSTIHDQIKGCMISKLVAASMTVIDDE